MDAYRRLDPIHRDDNDQSKCECHTCEHYELMNARAEILVIHEKGAAFHARSILAEQKVIDQEMAMKKAVDLINSGLLESAVYVLTQEGTE